MERLDMYSASRCNIPNYLCRPSNYPVSMELVWAQNGKLPKFVRTYCQGAMFAPRKYLYQKEATGMRDQKCIPLVGAISQITCAGRLITLSRRKRYRAQNEKLRKLRRTYRHGTVSAPRKY